MVQTNRILQSDKLYICYVEDKQFEFIPSGDPPTVKNIWRDIYKAIIGLTIIMTFIFIISKPKWHIGIVALFCVLALFCYVLLVKNRYTIKININKNNDQFYLYYIMADGGEGTTVIDLKNATVDYKKNISKTSNQWVLTISEDTSSVELRETGMLATKDVKNCFSKQQLDEMYKIITSSGQ